MMQVVHGLYSLPANTLRWIKNNPVKSLVVLAAIGAGGYYGYAEAVKTGSKNLGIRHKFTDITGQSVFKHAFVAGLVTWIGHWFMGLDNVSHAKALNYRVKWAQGDKNLKVHNQTTLFMAWKGWDKNPPAWLAAVARGMLFVRIVDDVVGQLKTPEKRGEWTVKISEAMRKVLPFSVWSAFGGFINFVRRQVHELAIWKKVNTIASLNLLAKVVAGEEDETATHLSLLNALWVKEEGVQRLKDCLRGFQEKLEPEKDAEKLASGWGQTQKEFNAKRVAALQMDFQKWQKTQAA